MEVLLRLSTHCFPEFFEVGPSLAWSVRAASGPFWGPGSQSWSRCGRCDAAAARAQLTDQAPSKVVETFHSMYWLIVQWSPPAPCTLPAPIPNCEQLTATSGAQTACEIMAHDRYPASIHTGGSEVRLLGGPGGLPHQHALIGARSAPHTHAFA